MQKCIYMHQSRRSSPFCLIVTLPWVWITHMPEQFQLLRRSTGALRQPLLDCEIIDSLDTIWRVLHSSLQYFSLCTEVISSKTSPFISKTDQNWTEPPFSLLSLMPSSSLRILWGIVKILTEAPHRAWESGVVTQLLWFHCMTRNETHVELGWEGFLVPGFDYCANDTGAVSRLWPVSADGQRVT